MKVIFMGKESKSIDALRYLIYKNIDIVYKVWETSIITKEDLNLKNIDLVISYLYPKKIKEPLISLPRIGCINFHPAPLPKFRGFAPYSFGILESLPYWRVTAHFIDETIDTGDTIKANEYTIDLTKETACSLKQKSQEWLLDLFKEVIDGVLINKALLSIPQGKGVYRSKEEFEKLRKISPNDTLEMIDRKIRAFWCPPHMGAYIEIDGKEYTLVSEELMKGLECKNQ